MTKLKKYYYITPALLYYIGLTLYFILKFPGRWLDTICAVACSLLAQILVCKLLKRRGPLTYSFSYLVPTALAVSAAASLLHMWSMANVWFVLSLLFAVAVVVGSRRLRSIPRNTTAVWMGVFIILVIFTFLAGLLSVL